VVGADAILETAMLSRKFRAIAGFACLVAPLLVAATPVMAQKSVFVRSKPHVNVWSQATVQNAFVAKAGNRPSHRSRMPRRSR
jgi:hypothetical protein